MGKDNNGKSGREVASIEELKESMRGALRVLGGQDADDKDWSSQIAPYLGVHSARLPSPPSSSTPSPSSASFTGPEFPTATFDFTVQQEHSNRSGNLHGGCTATLFDYATSVALILVARPGHWQTLGISRTLNCTYIRPIPIGTQILIESEVVSAGKNMAQLRGVMRRKSDGAVLATCEHDKFNTDPPLEKL